MNNKIVCSANSFKSIPFFKMLFLFKIAKIQDVQDIRDLLQIILIFIFKLLLI